MVVEMEFFCWMFKGFMLFEMIFFLIFVLFYFCVRLDEKLYFYLFEFLYMENELFGYDFIFEGFINLCNIKW